MRRRVGLALLATVTLLVSDVASAPAAAGVTAARKTGSACTKAKRKLATDKKRGASAKQLAKDQAKVKTACALKPVKRPKGRTVAPNGRPISPALARRCERQPRSGICRRLGY